MCPEIVEADKNKERSAKKVAISVCIAALSLICFAVLVICIFAVYRIQKQGRVTGDIGFDSAFCIIKGQESL